MAHCSTMCLCNSSSPYEGLEGECIETQSHRCGSPLAQEALDLRIAGSRCLPFVKVLLPVDMLTQGPVCRLDLYVRRLSSDIY